MIDSYIQKLSEIGHLKVFDKYREKEVINRRSQLFNCDKKLFRFRIVLFTFVPN